MQVRLTKCIAQKLKAAAKLASNPKDKRQAALGVSRVSPTKLANELLLVMLK
jgi:hypothetical protein